MNAEDTLDVRPGRAAARELKILSPPVISVSAKKHSEAAKALGLPNWNKPAAACLRLPRALWHQRDAETALAVERAEAALFDLCFRELRVRHHGDVARLEVPEAGV